MIPQELKEAVVAEALLLRKHATKEEKDKLDFHSLNSNNDSLCIYGQMTGWCYSERAFQLLCLCAKQYAYSCAPYRKDIIAEYREFVSPFDTGDYRNFSAIEFYIAQKEAKIGTLIKLIKS